MPVFRLLTGDDVRQKIDWEGGLLGAIDSGLEAQDLPEAYRPDFAEIQRVYARLDELCTSFYSALPQEDDEALHGLTPL